MAEMVPVTITGVVRRPGDASDREERFYIRLTETGPARAGGAQRRVEIAVGDAEAFALSHRLQGHAFPRPMTYQFMAALVTASGSAVRQVRVTGAHDGIYYAQVMLRGGATVDARPSDALNLAAVTGVPVLVAAELLDQAALTN